MGRGEEGGKNEVEKILAARFHKGKAQYLVHWKGYPANKATWHDEEDLKCDLLLDEFRASREKRPPSTRNRKSSVVAKKVSEVFVQKAFRQSRLSLSKHDVGASSSHAAVTTPKAPAASNRETSGEPAAKKQTSTEITGTVDVSTLTTQGRSTSCFVTPKSRKRVTNPEASGSSLPTTPLNQAPAAMNRESSWALTIKNLNETGTADAADVSTPTTQGLSTSRIVDPTHRKSTRQTRHKSTGRFVKPGGQVLDLPTTPLNQNASNVNDSSITPVVQKAMSKNRPLTQSDVQGTPKASPKVVQKLPALTKLPLVQNIIPMIIPLPTMDVTVNGNDGEDDDNVIDVVTVDESTHDIHYSTNDLLQKMAQMEYPVLVQSGSGITVINKKPVDVTASPIAPLVQKALSMSAIPIQSTIQHDSPQRIVHFPWNDPRMVQESTDPALFVTGDYDDDVMIIDDIIGRGTLAVSDLHKDMPMLEGMVTENPIPTREVDDDDDVVFIGETIHTAPILNVSLPAPLPVQQNAAGENLLALQSGNDDDDDAIIIDDVENEGPAVVQVGLELPVGEEEAPREKADMYKIIAELFGNSPADPDGDAAIAAHDFTDCTITHDLRINGEPYYNVQFADSSEELVKEHIISKKAPGQWYMYTLDNLMKHDKKREEALQWCSKKARRRL